VAILALSLWSLWFIYRFGTKTPQGGVILCIVAAGIVSAASSARKLFKPTPKPDESDSLSESPSSFRSWLDRFFCMSESVSQLTETSAHVRLLLLETLAHQERRDALELERMIVNGAFPVPPAVRILFTVRRLGDVETVSEKNGFLSRFRLFFSDSPAPRDNAAIDRQLSAVISYLEGRLEARHD
jgi:hypothetical protein